MKLVIDVKPSQWADPFLQTVNDCGLKITGYEEADILVKTASEITSLDLESGKKIIALEKTSGGNIAFRQILMHPAVVRYIKSFNYDHFELHNEACVDGRLFTKFLEHTGPMHSAEFPINEEHYKKISLGWSILHYFRLRKLRSITNESLFNERSKRPFDVFFAGTLDYDDLNGMRRSADLISLHRRKCVEQIENLKGLKIELIKGKLLSLEIYNDKLCQSKIVISPWGWGEPCYRDFEALMAGCILIKPMTDFVRSACGIYKNGSCLWVKPDFSDLDEKIRSGLEIFEASSSTRGDRREAMISAIDTLPDIIRANLTL